MCQELARRGGKKKEGEGEEERGGRRKEEERGGRRKEEEGGGRRRGECDICISTPML